MLSRFQGRNNASLRRHRQNEIDRIEDPKVRDALKSHFAGAAVKIVAAAAIVGTVVATTVANTDPDALEIPLALAKTVIKVGAECECCVPDANCC